MVKEYAGGDAGTGDPGGSGGDVGSVSVGLAIMPPAGQYLDGLLFDRGIALG